MTELELKIQDAAQKYYTSGTSPLTDEEFDALVDQLRKENPDSPLLRVGWGYDPVTDTTPGAKIRHKYGRAGSLDKCRTWQELGQIFRKTPVDISLKLDGLSVVLYFQKGHLTCALTRGDGNVGIDITQKVADIFPTQVREGTRFSEFSGAVRGEILMRKDKFELWKKNAQPDAKNPRNSAAGIINSKDHDPEELSYLTLVVYTIVGDDEVGTFREPYDSVFFIRRALEIMFGQDRVVPYVSNVILQEDTFLDDMQKYKDLFEYYPYPSDGLVITQCDMSTMDLYPQVVYFAIAFKFPSESRESEVLEVEWNMSKTHYAVPKLHIRPIQLAGTTVEYCTGYHAQWIRDNKIGPGSVVRVQKRGEIIPNVDEVVKSTYPDMPTFCPDCGKRLEWEGVHLQCKNAACSNAIMQDTLIWIQNIAPRDGLGDSIKSKMLTMMVEGKALSDLSIESIMKCTVRLPDDGPSVQVNEFAKMWNSLHTCEISAVRAIQALNIPRIGGITAIKLAARFDLVRKVADYANASWTELPPSLLIDLKNCVGDANSRSIEANMKKFSRIRLIFDRIKVDTASSSPSKGKVAITGKLSVKRSAFEQELRAAGYQPGDISKDTKYLITDDPNSSSSKNKKADEWGIVKITESDFRNKYLR